MKRECPSEDSEVVQTPAENHEEEALKQPSAPAQPTTIEYDRGLTDVVRENPTAAVKVLKNWLNKAG